MFSPDILAPFFSDAGMGAFLEATVPTLPPAHILVSGDANSAEILDDFLR